ncbi:hypothetical protein ACFMBG_14890, partial [Leisingera sp. D0M16]|uniref:hypothetical protein n=1 Tax=Leisingera coralii TaxID=3351347 RepID=UPI003B7ECE77
LRTNLLDRLLLRFPRDLNVTLVAHGKVPAEFAYDRRHKDAGFAIDLANMRQNTRVISDIILP